ncbi:MAG: very short patch repair endonuclease [Candidatus Pararuminococcus gallinarum]|jgi:DNA mismatch endonuclease (patch repair protein)
MADVFTHPQRSAIMRAVKSSGNKSTEVKLIQYFQEKHITGWRRGYQVKGHPDFVFLQKRIAIFVDGCFWHGHDCRNTKPSANSDYWRQKQQRNIIHDQEITALFEQRGWTVIRIWECELKKKNRGVLEAKLSPLLND